MSLAPGSACEVYYTWECRSLSPPLGLSVCARSGQGLSVFSLSTVPNLRTAATWGPRSTDVGWNNCEKNRDLNGRYNIQGRKLVQHCGGLKYNRHSILLFHKRENAVIANHAWRHCTSLIWSSARWRPRDTTTKLKLNTCCDIQSITYFITFDTWIAKIHGNSELFWKSCNKEDYMPSEW